MRRQPAVRHPETGPGGPSYEASPPGSPLTPARTGPTIEGVPSDENGPVMFRSLSTSLLSFWLVIATALAGVAPSAMPEWRTQENQAVSSSGCGPCCANRDHGSRSCCARAVQPPGCPCVVEKERPAPPIERRTSDERNEQRRLESAAVVLIFPEGDNPSRAAVPQDAALTSVPSAQRRQAALCRWLT